VNRMSEPLLILLIEDNQGDAELIKELITDTGVPFDMIWLDDGEKAIHFFNDQGKVDIIIIDLKLPRVSGHEIVEILRDRGTMDPAHTIILTGSDSPEDLDMAKKNGVENYIIKPMSMEEMSRITLVLKDIISIKSANKDPN
jgi:CheY-like chemotaxis protein